MLKELQFSDLLLHKDGSAKLKDCCSGRLMPVPEDCAEEIKGMEPHISRAILKKTNAATARMEYNGVLYRVARIEDVERGDVWFLRRLPAAVPSLESLNVGERYGSGMFAVVSQWLLAPEQTQGLVLISGPQASGKTTLASAFVAERLTRYGGHGVTFENPAELPLSNDWGGSGSCFQVEINGEEELAHQIERAHRYASPNIIFIGEIRTKFAARESLRVALGSSRQIVVATIHGLSLTAAIQRLLNWARELDGENAQDNLATSLLAAIHLSLEEDEGRPTLQIPEFLLLPFNSRRAHHSIRSKLRAGQLESLEGDIMEQCSRITYEGVKGI